MDTDVFDVDTESTRMISSDLAVDDILVSIATTSQKLKKNILTGDIEIGKYGRSSASAISCMKLKNVEFVSGNVIRYQKSKTVKILLTLQQGIAITDLIGICSMKHFGA